MKIIKYTVEIDYKDFVFSNALHAMEFARIALNTQAENYNISIKLKNVDLEQELEMAERRIAEDEEEEKEKEEEDYV